MFSNKKKGVALDGGKVGRNRGKKNCNQITLYFKNLIFNKRKKKTINHTKGVGTEEQMFLNEDKKENTIKKDLTPTIITKYLFVVRRVA